jgi:hypothetical protein
MRLVPYYASLAAVVGISAIVSAAAPHLAGNPTTTDNGTTLTVTGSLADLPAQDVTIKVKTSGVATVSCVNPGSNDAAGQNKGDRRVRVTVTGEQTVTIAELTSGVANFNVTTNAPTFNSAKGAGCPNDNWTAETKDVTFRNVQMWVIQNGKPIIKKTLPVAS